jgi:hypothetical protein
MKTTFLKDMESQVQEDIANAAMSQQVSTVNTFNSTTQKYIVQALAQAG